MPKETVKVCRRSSPFMTFHLWSFVVGDFGLATSSLAAVDPSDVSPRVVLQEADMTLGWFIFQLLRAFV